MQNQLDLTRFLDAQNQLYLQALAEIKAGHKKSHWMWFIFPQLKGLGRSQTARFYALQDLDEATAFLRHPVLGRHLVAISRALLQLEGRSAHAIFGSPDDRKLLSSMTLFANVPEADAVFEAVIGQYFGGFQDELTLQLLRKDKLRNGA